MLSIVVLTVLGTSVGVLVGHAWAEIGWRKRVEQATELARALEYGKLGQTLDEGGPDSFRILARSLNGVSANFQEVLLLFAHHVRHMRDSMETMEDGESTGNLDLLHELSEMNQVLHDFDYYRVRIENNSITDTGVAPRMKKTGLVEMAVSGKLTANLPSRTVGGSYDE